MKKSILFKIQKNYGSILERSIKTLPKTTDIQVDETVKVGDFKQYKNHPGKFMINFTELPDELEDRINKVIGNFNMPQMKEQIKNFKNYLHHRRCPVEKNEIYYLKDKIREEILIEDDQQDSEDSEKKLEKILKSKLHPWLKIEYTERLGHLYLASRFASDYAVLKQIFNEIKKRDANFFPKQVFDFGSGVGTVMWASQSVWESDSIGFFNIDSSAHMNNIANLVTRNGTMSNPSFFKSMFFKRNFPKSDQEKYDMVTSAFTLLELSDRAARFENLTSLWNKVKENGYLVLVENGTKHGFRLINEARDFILKDILEKTSTPEIESKGNILAPCPHSMTCPLMAENQICRFFAGYRPLAIYDQDNKVQKEEFPYSYIIFKKSNVQSQQKWPRLVYKQPLNLTGGIIHSWLCTPEGNVEHLISSKNRCKTTRGLLRYSKLGDSLPIFIKPNKEIG